MRITSEGFYVSSVSFYVSSDYTQNCVTFTTERSHQGILDSSKMGVIILKDTTLETL